jgi:tRNA pseudouridine55 synthase
MFFFIVLPYSFAMSVHNVYKPLGWSSLDAVKELRRQQPDLVDIPITYAGRLDPMAEGVMVILSGEDRLAKSEFQKLNKMYKATFLFGVTSDTYDCLGLTETGGQNDLDLNKEEISEFLLGTHQLPFPPYSAYRVNGKPLHYWAKLKKLDEIVIPDKEMRVLSIQDLRLYKKDVDQVKSDLIRRVRLVRGDFRQEEIIERWKDFQISEGMMQLARCTLAVTSGTYIRSLAHEMGKVFGCGAILFSLERISVGTYLVQDSLSL